MKPLLENPYGYKVCYPINRKIYKYRYLTKTYKQAVDIKKMYYQYPPPDDNGKPINNVKWQIFPITRKEVIRGIWREDPFWKRKAFLIYRTKFRRYLKWKLT